MADVLDVPAPSNLARRIAERLLAAVPDALTPELEAFAKAAAPVDEVFVAPVIDPANPGRFSSVLAVEEERTADNRIIATDATTWRTPPLPLMLQTKTADGHDGSEIAGVIERIFRQGSKIIGEGRFDSGPAGLEAARLVAGGVLTGVSIDAGDINVEYIVEEEAADGTPTKVLMRYSAMTLLGATVVPFPAIGSTTIDYLAADGQEIDPAAVPLGTITWTDEPLTASGAEECTECERMRAELVDALVAAGVPAFPERFFANPEFDAPTPVRVTAEGHIEGHLALWGTCHVGFKGACVTPPRSLSGYNHFLLGQLPLENGGYQPIGTISLGTGHAGQNLSARDAASHYDHTGTAAAYVNVGEDAHGIWCSGIIKPGLPDEKVVELCAASLSGDWRNISGNLELVATLAVNVPGFPIATARNGEPLALVAAGYGPAQQNKQIWAQALDGVDRNAELILDLTTRLAAVTEGLAKLTEQTRPLIREHVRSQF